jgi:hypothetical protein
MAGSILYAMVVQYYYGYGDSFGFYQGAQAIKKIAESNGNPLSTFFANAEDLSVMYKFSGGDNVYMQAGITNSASIIIYKLTALLSYISFNSYLIISLFFGLFSFAGVWKLFCIFNEIQKNTYHKLLAYTVLFSPSVCFWGSGLMKDSLCLGLVCFIFSTGYQLFVKRKYSLKTAVLLLICIYVLYVVKSYILSALLLAALLTYIISLILKSRGNIIKLSFVFFILTSSMLLIYFSVSNTIESVIDESKQQIETFKNTYENSNEFDENSMAGFKEANFDFTVTGIVLRIPLKVGSTLFRPFIWETHKVIMLFSAAESLLMLLSLLYVIVICRPARFFYYIAITPEVFFSFVFIIVLAAIVGFTTFNFGTLVRYRLPILPFYFFMLLSIYSKRQQKKAATV